MRWMTASRRPTPDPGGFAPPWLIGLVAGIASASATTAADENWPGFLGPGGMAVAGESGAAVPSEFGDGNNVLWQVPSGSGHSSPCVWGDRIFLTGAEEGGRTMVMVALDRNDGSTVWERKVEGESEDGYGHRAAHPAMATPCTDGERVYFYFGGYGLLACGLEDGEVHWERQFPFKSQAFGTGTSPVLVDGSIVLVRDGVDDAAIHCFDAASGEPRWEVSRRGFRTNYATPFVWRNRDRTELVVPGTLSLRSHDPGDGRLLWSVGDLCVFPCTAPVGDRDRLYFAAWATPNALPEERSRASWGDLELTEEEAADPEFPFKRFDKNQDQLLTLAELPDSRARDAFSFIDRNGDGAISPKEMGGINGNKAPGKNVMVTIEAGHDGELAENSGVLWTHEEGLPYVPSPLVHNGRVYLVKSGGIVSCLDASTGQPFYDAERCGVSGEYYASPVALGDRVFLCAQRGIVLVLKAGDELEVLAQNKIGEKIYATPAVVDGTLYLRTDERLWAIGSGG